MNKNIRSFLISSAYFSLALLSSVAIAGQTELLKEMKFNDSPFPACKGVAMLKSSDFSKDEAFWKEVKDCGVNYQVLPDTGFLNTMISKLGEADDDARAASFLNWVGETALSYVDQNNAVTEKLIHCERNDQAWFNQKLAGAKSAADKALYSFGSCGAFVKDVMGNVGSVRPVLRQDLALSRYEIPNMAVKHDDARANINYSLNSQMGWIVPKMDPLSESEAQTAAAQYQSDTNAINKAWDDKLREEHKWINAGNNPALSLAKDVWKDEPGKPGDYTTDPYGQFATSARTRNQRKYQAKYMEDLAKAPILAFLGSANPAAEEVAKAAEKLLKNGQSERAKIVSALDVSKSDHEIVTRAGDVVTTKKTLDEKAKNLMRFMKYGPVVNQLLQGKPENCKVATGIYHYIKNTDMRNDVGLMVGMVGASFFVAAAGPAILAGTTLEGMGGAALATYAALPVGLGMTYNSYQNVENARTRSLNVVETVKSGKATGDIKDFQAAKGELTMSLALLPLNFMGMGGVKALEGAGANLADKFIVDEATQTALKSTLTAKGMAEPEVESVIAALRSGKPKVATAAVDKVIKTLDLDPNEIAMMQTVRERMGAKSERWVKMAMALLPKDEKERQATVKQAIEILDKINPAKLNDVSRPLVLKTVIAASRFGVKDPAVIAGNINEWDKGIEGLTSVYDLATKKMGTKAFTQIKDVAERQKKAFYAAIDDLSKNDPEFAGLTLEQRLAQEAKMCVCGACAR